MSDAVSIPVSGFSVPPMGGAGQQGNGFQGNAAPAAPKADFASVLPPASGPTEAQIQARIDAAVAAAQAPNKADADATVASVVPALVSSADVKPGAGDAVLNGMHSIFTAGAAGIDVHRAIGAAIASGDVSRIDKAYIAEKGGAQAEHLIVVAEAMVEHVKRQAEATTTEAHTKAGGQAQWQAAAAAFNAQAPAHLRAIVVSMLDSGNPESIKYGVDSIIDYAKNSGLVAVPGKHVQAGAANASADQALSKQEFQTALYKLDKNSAGFQAARADLFNRRTVGAQLGK